MAEGQHGSVVGDGRGEGKAHLEGECQPPRPPPEGEPSREGARLPVGDDSCVDGDPPRIGQDDHTLRDLHDVANRRAVQDVGARRGRELGEGEVESRPVDLGDRGIGSVETEPPQVRAPDLHAVDAALDGRERGRRHEPLRLRGQPASAELRAREPPGLDEGDVGAALGEEPGGRAPGGPRPDHRDARPCHRLAGSWAIAGRSRLQDQRPPGPAADLSVGVVARKPWHVRLHALAWMTSAWSGATHALSIVQPAEGRVNRC